MANKHLSRDYLFGLAVPVGYTKLGQLPPKLVREDDRPSRFFSQQFRRGHVQLYFALLFAFLALTFSTVPNIFAVFLGLSLVIPMMLIRISIYSINDLPTQTLDEREQLLSQQAFTRSYKIVFLLAIIGTACLFFSKFEPDNQELISLGFAFVSLIYILPSAIIAWSNKL